MKLALCLAILLASAAAGRALEIYIQPHYFTWEERGNQDEQLLKESGPMLGAGIAGRQERGDRAAWINRGEVFLGEIDYKGSTMLGAPLRTTTAYYGLKGETEWRASSLPASATWQSGWLGGLSTRVWLRQLDHSARDSNGYDEAWWMVYGRAGLFVEQAEETAWRWLGEASLRLPLFNYARYSLTGPEGGGDISVQPGRELSMELAVGVRTRDWLLSMVYEDFNFGRSDAESLPPFEVFQPESQGRSLSLRVGLAF